MLKIACDRCGKRVAGVFAKLTKFEDEFLCNACLKKESSKKPNGRTQVLNTFRASNLFGQEGTYQIRCLLDRSGLIEAAIN